VIVAVVVVVLIVAGWRLDVYFHPFAPCRRCKGSGQNPGSRTTAYGLCRHGPRRTRLLAKSAAARHIKRGK
jgi:hypothetical protein